MSSAATTSGRRATSADAVPVKELGLGEMRVNSAGCLDRCDLGPVMVVYPEGVWYNYRTREDVDEIVESHLKGGKPVERLRLPARE